MAWCKNWMRYKPTEKNAYSKDKGKCFCVALSASRKIKWRFPISKNPSADNLAGAVNCCHRGLSTEVVHHSATAHETSKHN